ncbi:MAG: DUF366 family protein [Deltaproteobacteria bacterium]|nr:MAG: DUF366 family protein [Deltaproteobacteria bacterium]
MLVKFLDPSIDYDGTQLAPHWIFKNFQVLGNSLVAFSGKCDVALDKMVDLVDVQQKKPIYSQNMIHFIGEFFGINLETTILYQRLLVSLAQQELISRTKKHHLVRGGNDLYDEDAKLSVSIATASPVSTLIHFGINIESKGTPVKTKGLLDYGINPTEIGKAILESFKHEFLSAQEARSKVRPVY